MKLLAEDGTWILWTGAVWVGRKTIEDGHAEVDKTVFRNSTQRERLEELTFVGPDAAVVRFCSTLIGNERSPDKLVRSRKFLVVRRRAGVWGVSWGPEHAPGRHGCGFGMFCGATKGSRWSLGSTTRSQLAVLEE